ncbi:hypothetical protein ACN20G_05665 [Streptomyces sp. BI20]|uniref:hypothetical protein n=1 Tax=Streptomyces sp. BI20 TaxID=3403460 RepID=UPI003C794181
MEELAYVAGKALRGLGTLLGMGGDVAVEYAVERRIESQRDKDRARDEGEGGADGAARA